jgi:predicted DNA-binding protein
MAEIQHRSRTSRDMLYTALDMSATRTQVYLTEEQRRLLDERGRHEDRSLASLVREAIDAYLAATPDPAVALESTYGTLPDLEVPARDEWTRG